MSLPGRFISQGASALPSGPSTDVGRWFIAGTTEKGPVTPTTITSMGQYDRLFGGRTGLGIVLHDAVETFFAEGGKTVVVSRVVGPDAATASKTFDDASAADSIRVEASSPGAWGNALQPAIVAGSAGTFIISVLDGDDVEVERSPELADVASAVAWASNTDNVRVVALGTVDPAPLAAAAMTGGDDDSAAITDAEWAAALDLFTEDMGPGQVSYPGRTGGTAHADLQAHAKDRSRIAILDVAVTDVTKAALKTHATAGRANPGAERSGLFGPWATIAGLVPGTTRSVPYSAVEAGLIARLDSLYGNPNRAAAGDDGIPRTVLSLKVDGLSAADREELNNAGLNLARTVDGTIKTYGFRTLADPITKPLDWQLANARLDMAVSAHAGVIAERYVFKPLTSLTISRFGADLSAEVLAPLYAVGALFGDTAEDAYSVNVGESVNPVEELALGKLKAVIGLKRAPMAEQVFVEVFRVRPQDAV